MASLLVIRHGQASFHDEDYDKLSERGVEQGRRLGAWLASQWRELDAVVSGPLKRQRDTAAAMAKGARDAGGTLPDATIDDAWIEYPAIELLARGLPILAERDEEVRAVLGEMPADLRNLSRLPSFEELFRKVRNAWKDGELELDGVETFAAFRERVATGLASMLDRIGDGRGAVITSGGPIGFVMQSALGISDERALEIGGIVKNSSLTVVRRQRGGLELLSFNGLPHLRDRELITLR